jgi:hypothetical protein
MTGGMKAQCSPMKLDGFIKIRQDALLLESVIKAACKIVERRRSKRMTERTKEQCSPMKLDGFIKIRQDALLLESVIKAACKIVERH